MEEDFGYVANKDIDGILSLAHPEIVEEFIPFRTVQGKTELRNFFEQQFHAVPDMDFEVESIFEVDHDTAVGQWRIRGTFTGGEFEGIKPTGRRVDLRGIDVMRFEDGLLRHNTIYFDGLAFARQIGMLPAEDSAGDRAIVAAFNGLTSLKRGLKDVLDRR